MRRVLSHRPWGWCWVGTLRLCAGISSRLTSLMDRSELQRDRDYIRTLTAGSQIGDRREHTYPRFIVPCHVTPVKLTHFDSSVCRLKTCGRCAHQQTVPNPRNNPKTNRCRCPPPRELLDRLQPQRIKRRHSFHQYCENLVAIRHLGQSE